MERAGRVATLTLQRPPVNALDLALLERLAGTVRALGEEGEATVLVLRSGLPGMFCGGFDVKALPDAAAVVNTRADVLSRSRAAQWAVLESPLVVISAIGGPAIGLGFLIPALGDVIVASRSARFGLPEIELNLIGGAGHCRRVMAEPVVRYLTLTGRRVGPEYLERLGAVALVVEDGALDVVVGELAAEIGSRDPAVVRNTKVALERSLGLDVKRTYALEHDLHAAVAAQQALGGRGG